MADLLYYAGQIQGKSCRWCGTTLKIDIQYYEHHGGFKVDDFEKKQWLYTVCPNPDCKYQWALRKIGIYEVVEDAEVCSEN